MKTAEYLVLICALAIVLAALALRLLIHSIRYEFQGYRARRSSAGSRDK